MRVAVAGAGGQLGAAVVHEFAQSHETIPLTRADVDITDDAAVSAAIDRITARRDHQLRRVQRRRRRRGSPDRGAERERLCRARVRPCRQGARRHFHPVQFGFRLRRHQARAVHRRGPAQSTERVRRLKIAGRMVRGRRPARIRHARGDSVRTGARWPTAQRIDWRDGEEAPSRRGSRRLRRSDRFANCT